MALAGFLLRADAYYTQKWEQHSGQRFVLSTSQLCELRALLLFEPLPYL